MKSCRKQDLYRAQFWAAFDGFVPGTPLRTALEGTPGASI